MADEVRKDLTQMMSLLLVHLVSIARNKTPQTDESDCENYPRSSPTWLSQTTVLHQPPVIQTIHPEEIPRHLLEVHHHPERPSTWHPDLHH
jgi:hypothetical protein